MEKDGILAELFEDDISDTLLVVIFFDDALLDATAEKIRIKTQMQEFNCLVEFKAYARSHFKTFNGRQCSEIMSHIVYQELDIDTLVHTGVIISYLNLHEKKEQKMLY
jgi:hypothetical protein